MTIISLEQSEHGQHDIKDRSDRLAPWLPGYIEVPPHLESAAWASGGFCDLAIENGALVGITPTERPPEPVPEPVEPQVDELTMTQLAVAELAQTVEDNNTANQLAIAELAELMTGGGA